MRQKLRALAGLATIAALGGLWPLAGYSRQAEFAFRPSRLTFEEVPHGNTETHADAKGYQAQTLIRWGDPLEPGAPPFDQLRQTAAAQAKQWGYNNDFIAWMPLPAGSDSAGRGLLCVNFEYTEAHLMFPGLQAGEVDEVTRQQVDTERAAHGHEVVEIRRDGATGDWSVVEDSPYSRRITALATECRISGPAAATLGCRRTVIRAAPGTSARSAIAPAARHRGGPC